MFKNQVVRYKRVFDRKKEVSKKGKALVQIEAYLDGNRRYFSTGIYLTPGEWSQKNRDAKDSFVSSQIRQVITRLEDYEKEIRYFNNGRFELTDFAVMKASSEVEPVTPTPITFNRFFADQMKARDKEIKWNTFRQHQACLNLLNEFAPAIAFEDLKFKFVDELHQFMTKKGHGKSTTQKRHIIIKGYIEKAVKLDLLARNPYDTFSVPKPVVNKASLLPAELKLLENINLEGISDRVRKVRNMFLFSVYTGLRWGDIIDLTPANFIETGDGLVMQLKASKTDKMLTLPLSLTFEGKAEPIVRLYIGQDSRQKLFKGIHNAFANKSLKELAKLAGIKKSIHFHMARHTAATIIAQKAGVPTAKQVLQHQKLETTLAYIHHSGEEVNKALKEVKNWY